MPPEETPPPSPQPAPPVYSTNDGIVATFKTLSYLLSARALLLVTLVGVFVLAIEAMRGQTLFGLFVLVAFIVGAVFPVTFLETRRRP